MKTKILAVILFTFPLVVLSQNSRVMYFMNIPQNRIMNPAIRPSDSVNIALPASGFALSFNNNFLNFSDIITEGRGDSLISLLHPEYDQDKFLERIRRQNSLDLEFSMQLLGLGFRTGKSGYAFLDINERALSRTVIPGSLFELALRGNEPFAGDYLDLSTLKADIRYYHEIGLGYSWDITKRIRAGVKGKLLLGAVSANLANRSLGIRIDDNYTHTLDADATLNFSGPVTVIRDSEGNIEDIEIDDDSFGNAVLLRSKANPGMAIDAGITYNLTDKIVLSAAITDLGFIRWKNGVTNLSSVNQFEFGGVDMTDVINGDQTFEEAGEALLDSLEDAFVPVTMNQPWSTFLPSSLNIGGSYKLSKTFTLGVLSSSRFMGKQLKESLTMSVNMNLGSSLLATASYTASNHRFDNFGIGLAARLSIFQFYIMSDRIPLYWNKIYTSDRNDFIPVPANWNTFDLRFGMNLVFGHRKNKTPEICEPVAETGPGPEEIEN